MKKVTSQWLQNTNVEFKQQGINDGEQKIKLAVAKWRKENVPDLLKDKTTDQDELSQHIDKQVAKIKSYFLTQTTKDRGNITSQFVGIFYFYGNFWEISVPIITGASSINFFEHLHMPSDLKNMLASEQDSLDEFISVYADSVDYGYGIEEVENVCKNDFSKSLFKSADKHLRATMSLLNQREASSKAIEDARMGVEIFLKSYLAEKEHLTDNDLKKQFGHDLEKAVERCISNGLSELAPIKAKLNLFPAVQARYEASELAFGELWEAYRIVHETGTAILRNLTGRDIRKFVKINKIPSGNYLSLLKYVQLSIGSQYQLTAIVFPEKFRDVYLDISPEILDEIFKIAVADKISGLDVLKIGDVIFGTYGATVFLGEHITISLEFKSYENFANSLAKNSDVKSYKILDFYANSLGFTEILELEDGLELKIYIEKKYVPEWR